MVKMKPVSTFRKCRFCAKKFDDENREIRIREYMRHKKECIKRIVHDLCGRCGKYPYDEALADDRGLFLCSVCVEENYLDNNERYKIK